VRDALARLRRRPRPATLLSALALAGGIGTGGCLAAETAVAPAPAVRTDVQWLDAIRRAADQQSYQGVYTYARGDSIRSSRIAHAVEGGVVVERVQPMDGKPRECIRRGDSVEWLYQDDKRIVASHASPAARFPALVSAAAADILKHYAFELEGVERVAGTSCQLIRLRPRDGLRYGYELCVEPATGLMLKIRTRDNAGAQVDQMAFSEVRIGDRIDPAELKTSWETGGWTRQQRDIRDIDLARLGWIVVPPAGFYRHREVARRVLDEHGQPSSAETYQEVLTDGLATVSIFIESDAAAAPSVGLDVPQHRGPASVYARRVGAATVTVVGEVPQETVQAIARSVEFRDPH